ncbi:SEC-C metal-binding domain-containing protein [Rhodococcus sp. NPDC058505]|uniref:SEC-C metal-binding domain-containing protein n=1 Tax=unclassified Rhodococcus (in: high G+C Gram-positive bacteria) TaxID=192944 RepID=UPI00364BDF7B
MIASTESRGDRHLEIVGRRAADPRTEARPDPAPEPDPRELDVPEPDAPELDVPELDAAGHAIAELRRRGPLSTDDWVAALVERGLGTTAEMAAVVRALDDSPVGVLADGRVAALDGLLEGRVFTHRLSAEEVASGVLDIDPDLSALSVLAGSRSRGGECEVAVVSPTADAAALAARGRTEFAAPEIERLLLDPDLLHAATAGDLIGLGLAGGRLRLVRVDRTAPAPDLIDALREVIADGAVHTDPVVWQLVAEHPDLFTAPTAPLTELLAAAGHVCERNYLAPNGFDFDAHHRTALVESIARENRLNVAEAGSVVDLTDLVHEVADAVERGEDPSEVAAARVTVDPRVFRGLADPSAAAVAFDLATLGDDRAEALHAVASALIEHASRRVRPAAHWLAGKAADQCGDVLVAVTQFELALDRDPDWTLAAFDLALLAADAGDVPRAQSLLARIEGGDADTLQEVLARYQPADRRELGRNDRCWCGSGRKYKACHLGRSDLTADARASWLYTKALMFARTPELFDLVHELAEIRAAHTDDEDATITALEGGLVIDAALFEGGVLEQFVARRAQVLPAQELELARQWLGGSRGVYEVTAVSPGRSLTLCDVAGGEPIEVVDAVAGHHFAVGGLVCARLLPTGESVRAFGGIEPIDPRYRGELVEMCGSAETEPDELVDVLSLAFMAR